MAIKQQEASDSSSFYQKMSQNIITALPRLVSGFEKRLKNTYFSHICALKKKRSVSRTQFQGLVCLCAFLRSKSCVVNAPRLADFGQM
jgi:hypothetical protein